VCPWPRFKPATIQIQKSLKNIRVITGEKMSPSNNKVE
jgi:hypothetical protein